MPFAKVQTFQALPSDRLLQPIGRILPPLPKKRIEKLFAHFTVLLSHGCFQVFWRVWDAVKVASLLAVLVSQHRLSSLKHAAIGSCLIYTEMSLAYDLVIISQCEDLERHRDH